MPWLWVSVGWSIALLIFVLPGMVRAFIDWRFDGIVVTTDSVIIIDQTSLFHTEVRQMHMENFASVSASTQYWNLFSFGRVFFDLKEGVGQRLSIAFVPQAERIAFLISEQVRMFQRNPAMSGPQATSH